MSSEEVERSESAYEPQRIWSWASSVAERDTRIRDAQAMVGRELRAVRYVNIDYRRWDLHPEALGARVVTEPDEWAQPTWDFGQVDSIDYGVEIETTEGQVFSVRWDPPGRIEGLGIREEPMRDSLNPDGEFAIWDVTQGREWRRHHGAAVLSVDLHYEPWDEDGAWWCPRISLRFPEGAVEFLLAEANPDGGIVPSADNVLVCSTAQLPAFERQTP